MNEALNNLPKLDEWLSTDILNILSNISWNDAIENLHKPKKSINKCT